MNREQAEKALLNAHKAGDTDSARKIARFLKQGSQTISRPEAFTRGMKDMTSFGLDDEMRGFGRAIGQKLRGNEEDFSQLRQNATQDIRNELEQSYEQRPFSTGSGAVVGAVAPAFTPAGQALLARVGSGGLAAQSVKGAASGAASSGLYGLGSEEGELMDRLPSAASSAAVGAAIGGSLPAALRGASKLNTKKSLPDRQKVKEAAQKLYKVGREKGADFTEDATTGLKKAVQEQVISDPFAKKALGEDAIDAFSKNIDSASDINMTLESFENIDKRLGSLVNQAYKTGDDDIARRYDIIQSKLRGIVENPDNIKGTTEGVEAYRKATKLWANQAKLKDIEEILENAQYYVGGEASGIKAGFTRLAKSNKLYQYSPKQVRAIQKAAKTGNVEGVLRTLGSRLMVIGGAVKGGPAGAAAGYAASQAARGGASVLKGADASRVGRLVSKDAVEIAPELMRTQPRISLEQLLRLTTKEARQIKP